MDTTASPGDPAYPPPPRAHRTATPQSRLLTSILRYQPRPLLAVFLPAGFPHGHHLDALVAACERGADVLEIGIPTPFPVLDGPVIAAAYRQALAYGTDMRQTLTGIRLASAATHKPIVVMAYWSTVVSYGAERLAWQIATAGAAGMLVPDLPPAHAARWLATASGAGLHTPVFVQRATELRLPGAASLVYASAAAARTGYQGALDLPALAGHVREIRRAAPGVPVLAGVGISTPTMARAVVRHAHVDGVVIGTPFVRPLFEVKSGMGRAADVVGEFATAVHLFRRHPVLPTDRPPGRGP